MFDFLKEIGKAVADGMGLNVPQSAAPNTPSPSEFDAAPDKPVPFGYNNSWLCIKAGSPEEVIGKMGLKNPRVSSWHDGIYKNERGVFVSPVLDGYVLVIGWEGDILDTNPARLDELAGMFPELQFFSSHTAADYYVWAKFVGGKPVRVYGYNRGDLKLVANKGVPTPEETELHCDDFPVDDGADVDTAIFPDGDCVMLVSAAWGIDTKFKRKTYPESTGFVCGI
ncbi:MAG: hypothetical protein NC299_04910 [Lachnospiraceae bacterium]|nr:hypothetical protein [Ruminococcus sp.]MCM1274690.1 hypothetical protein [Lachnospiraceae bacterium]